MRDRAPHQPAGLGLRRDRRSRLAPRPPGTDRERPEPRSRRSRWDRIVERHGHLAAIREAMLVLEDLPAATRLALVAKLSDTLAQFVVARELADRRPGRADRQRGARAVDREPRGAFRGEDMRGLVAHLRATGQLTAGLMLRALLSGNVELFEQALAELSGLPQARVSALVHDRGGAGLQALLIRPGLPASTFRRSASRSRPCTRPASSNAGRRHAAAAPHGRASADRIARPIGRPSSR